jgi:hypothetical protein
LGHWHALAKLRLHTDITLNIMDEVTTLLGESLRTFQEKTCSAYDTRELSREAGARYKRQAKAAAAQSRATPQEVPHVPGDTPVVLSSTNSNGEAEVQVAPHTTDNTGSNTSATKKRKRAKKPSGTPPVGKITTAAEEPTQSDRLSRLKKPLNLNTYKNHSLGDYTNTIRRYGTTDSYSTEMVITTLTCWENFNSSAYFHGVRVSLNIEHQRNGICVQVGKVISSK